MTEIRIPRGRSLPDRVVSDSVQVSKTIPVVNTAPFTPGPEKEKKRETNPYKSKSKTSNSEDKKDTNISMEPKKTST